MRKKIEQYYPVLLLTILAFAFVTRIYRLHIPENYMFDEVYHAVTAKLIAKNDPRAYEWWNPAPEPNTAVDWLHPPLAKLTQAASIKLLGETSFGWRLSSAVFGVLVILITVKLADALFNNKSLALLAGLIASLDGLLLVQSRIAMNDIHVTFFIILTLLWYWQHRSLGKQKYLWLAGIAAGLAVASKWSGALLIGGIGLYEFLLALSRLWQKRQLKQLVPEIKRGALLVTSFLIIPALIYLLSYSQMFLQGKDLSHLRELHRQIWSYQTGLTATHPAQSKPFEWFLDLRPAWYAVEYKEGTKANIYAFGNPAIFWLGAIAVIITSIFVLIKKHKLTEPMTFLLFMYFMTWVPWQFSPRVMFFYHYTPAVPLLVIILAYSLMKVSIKLRLFALGIIIATFIAWFPHWTLIQMPTEFVDNVYYFLDGWQQR
ncbi:MAG: dolichyl-phosphate-mannose--protein mannosyltransferase [Candidatus Pacebacteria bacterium CG10_big_fil_rev_8_21_14_0_10_42_12]|nr:MAG: dolichyl-phosphate-mannose--protein mannosyltransferase [Candidatus Pacebacteria bacterium CG10_big_fil_rev_8_21_14_0_10_42_12]